MTIKWPVIVFHAVTRVSSKTYASRGTTKGVLIDLLQKCVDTRCETDQEAVWRVQRVGLI